MFLPNYEYFLRIVECRNISKAAESLFLSQPSLSKYLQRLEAELGAELFDRSQNPMKLTTAGEYFCEYIHQVELQKRTLLTRISEIQNEGRAKLTIGMPLWRANVLLPEFLPIFRKKHPMIELQLKEGSAAKLEAALMDEEIDLGIMNLPVNYNNTFYEPIMDEHIFLIGSKSSPVVQRLLQGTASAPTHHVDIHEFEDQPFILTQPDQHITGFVSEMLSRHNIELNCIFRTANVSTAVNLVAAGMGFSFVPETGTQSRYFPADALALFTIDEPPLHCTLAAVYKKNRYIPDASKIFIQELRAFCNQLR